MSNYKVVRNATGDLICYGPNTNQYGPGIPAGATLFIEENVPTYPITRIKAEKIASLEGSRKQAIATLPPVTVAGKQFPADSEYQGVISNLSRRLAAALPVPAALRGVDGSSVTLNAALLNSLDNAISGAVQAQWDKYWLKFEAVQAATTADAVALVVW